MARKATPVRVQRAMAHPLRARILAALDGGEELSPVELARALSVSLGVVSYHVRVLAEAGVVELARTTPRRGAIQHHYRLVDGRGAVTGSVALSAEGADRLADEVRGVVDRARRRAAAGDGAGDVEVTVLVHRVALS